MDFIKKFDIELEKENYYAGELLRGWVIVENVENLKVKGVKVFLRGKAHVEWKITRGGERRTVKEDEYFIDDKVTAWGENKTSEPGKSDESGLPMLPKGDHRLQFEFHLPESALPCSFESRIGTIRYYLRVVIDTPYASPPQGLKYFTIIGPHVDCMDARYQMPVTQQQQSHRCAPCCFLGPTSLQATTERTAYCCGENIRLKCDVQNGSNQNVWLICRLIQTVQFHINKGVLGQVKELSHVVWEYRGQTVKPHSSDLFSELHRALQVPVMPPTLTDVCKLIEIYYSLKVSLCMEKSGEDIELTFPLVIATMPYRIPNSSAPELRYELANSHAEGGMYISPEFQLGQVYDGTQGIEEDIILYRPTYVCVAHEHLIVTNTNNVIPRLTDDTRRAARDNVVRKSNPTT